MFTLIVAVVAVGFFLFLDNLVTTTKMSGKIQKSYTTQDPVLVRVKPQIRILRGHITESILETMVILISSRRTATTVPAPCTLCSRS